MKDGDSSEAARPALSSLPVFFSRVPAVKDQGGNSSQPARYTRYRSTGEEKKRTKLQMRKLSGLMRVKSKGIAGGEQKVGGGAGFVCLAKR